MNKRANEIRLRGEVEHRHDGDALLRNPGDAVLVQRGRPRSLQIMCPDGCGEVLSINLDARTGKAWNLYRNNNAISLSPSVWRDGGCESHFIVWRSHIMWCDRYERGYQGPAQDIGLETKVLAALDPERYYSAYELAEQLNRAPWEVARAADSLAIRGLAEYGTDTNKNRIRRKIDIQPRTATTGNRGIFAWLRRMMSG